MIDCRLSFNHEIEKDRLKDLDTPEEMASDLSVEHLLVAEFDIDRGPTMAHQYPKAVDSDVTQLAELMLPDQMHVRTEDWTIFFLRSKAHNGQDTQQQTSDHTQPMYVLNLVTTKHDSGIKRLVHI